MLSILAVIVPLLAETAYAGFFRVNCAAIQHGRVDPILNPGVVGTHVHKVSGGYNFAMNSTYEDMLASKCTSCEISADKSAYWTPQLYYRHADGQYEFVPSGGHLVYYLGRGNARDKIQPFPPGFRMVSGNSMVRSFNDKDKTWNGQRPIADRVSFACLDGDNHYKETPNMVHTSCKDGMRAQIQFPSCWDGKNAYKEDGSHVAYMSGIDNGECPSSHPIPHVHLFFEVYYRVNQVDRSKNGKFVFSNGDETGYGFHGDFLNGWDPKVLEEGLKTCVIGENPSGQISECAPLRKVQSSNYGKNCPERSPQIDEPVKGLISRLPGCNQPGAGPSPARMDCKPSQAPKINYFPMSNLNDVAHLPAVNEVRNGWQYLGAAKDLTGRRALDGASFNGDQMTIRGCQDFCSGKGFKLAGLEYGRECYCGNDFRGDVQLGRTAASPLDTMTCSGNDAEFCGGPNKLLVYKKIGR